MGWGGKAGWCVREYLCCETLQGKKLLDLVEKQFLLLFLIFKIFYNSQEEDNMIKTSRVEEDMKFKHTQA